MNDWKSKRVANVDLSSRCFAYVGDEQKTETWKLCIHVPGDSAKTRSLVATALHRFDEAKLPEAEKQRVFDTVRGAAMCMGLQAEQRTFAATNDKPTPPVPVRVNEHSADVIDPAIA